MPYAIFGLGPLELAIIIAIIVVLFLPALLPRLAKRVGETITTIKDMAAKGLDTDEEGRKKERKPEDNGGPSGGE